MGGKVTVASLHPATKIGIGPNSRTALCGGLWALQTQKSPPNQLTGALPFMV